MTQNKPSQLAKRIRDLARSRPDLLKSDGEPSTLAIARATQHQKYKLSQPTVSRIFRGEIQDPTTAIIRAFAELFRVSEHDIRGDTTFAAPTTPEAEALAQRFSLLPREAQKFLLSQVEAILGLVEADPKTAARVYRKK